MYRIRRKSTRPIVKLVLVLTTLGAETDAAALARTLVEERLAACVNVLPAMTSIYRWKGSVEQEREQQLLIKTAAEQVEALAARLSELHPYELPEFIVLDADASEAYGNWIAENTRAG
jgi:periplasmic divalent cation tolerance protein